MDFSLLLVVAVAVTGLVWLLDILVLKRSRRTAGGTEKEPWYVDYSRSFFPVLLAVLVIRSFIIEPFQIPSGSMRPTLKVGDYIAVNKFAYGLRLPVLNTRFLSVGEPKRGDVMVFRFPGDPDVDFIKRVIGLPGDTLRYADKQLYINDKPVPKELLEADAPDNAGEQLFEEHLGDVSHQIYNNPNDAGPQTRTITVPEGHYFVMGDNRDHSNDSRYWGFVPEENIVGKAFAVWMHWHDGLPSFSSVRLID
ncbi:signal peptidase I [Larsenimonas rhizosphaerae]|uniref:Signal peptidase I n=1 Tax=Larsenimonas rhizosphaerae TaxID=2944682 RepID=A0AA41ZE43_9GAMM|nr:signal peptidase I [Larsenimonas rhizosphaerae]MCM2130932.1 signal peptidase I [Larsenimonas rhizosphaerae]MCX2523637.1 signal peptidase I [Larsenimonas rhizosphaerae]